MACPMPEIRRGDVLWADFSPTRGREQSGQRPALIVASNEFLASIPALAIALPITTVDRGWAHHVRLKGQLLDLPKPSWTLTEQPRTISRDRLTRTAGRVDPQCLSEVDEWLRDFLALH